MDRADPIPPPGARVHLVSLGCPKNLVDSETILGRLGSRGLVLTPEPELADVIVINTCGFVESAKEESIQAILDACELKKGAPEGTRVVVTGCLAQRHGREIREEIPEVDAVVGLGAPEELSATIEDLLESSSHERPLCVGDPDRACQAEVGRVRLTPAHYAYVKISEGCDNPCTFCAIPAIRGRFRSKPIELVLQEARELAASGARELVLISQDTTSYGIDLYGRLDLPRLLQKLSGVEGIDRIRVLYAYPAFLSDAMLDAIASLPNVVEYLDLPLQHISDSVLKRMGRRMDEKKTRALLARVRRRVPGIFLRTTFIVGFPGEREEDFQTLEGFVREFEFERLGVFSYSSEEGTFAARFADPVARKEREERRERLMLAQQEIAFRHNRERRGEVVSVLVDEVGGTGGDLAPGEARARSAGEAPEIDPCILIPLPDGHRANRRQRGTSPAGAADLPEGLVEIPIGSGRPRPELRAGQSLEVRITGSRGYDLLASVLRTD